MRSNVLLLKEPRYGRMRDQIMVEKHRQVVDSTLGQDQDMVELTSVTVRESG